jgi:hypothetical protein
MHIRWRIWRGGASALSSHRFPRAQGLSYFYSPPPGIGSSYLSRTFRRLLLPLSLALLPLLIPASALAALPDHRAYEMVSPVEKGGLSLVPNLAVTDASGEHVIVDGGSYNSLLSNGASWMLETRTPTGWSGVQIGPSPAPEANAREQDNTGLVAVSEGFTRFAFATIMPLDSRISRPSMNIYTREGSSGPLAWASGPPSPLVSVSEPGECQNGVAIEFCSPPTNRAILAGTSADLGTLVWGQFHPLVAPPASLLGYPPDTHEHGYEVYSSDAGSDQLVGLVPHTGESGCGPERGPCVVPPCGAAMGNEGGASPYFGGFAPIQGAVSGDGSQVIFTSPDPSTNSTQGCVPPEIYLREKGTTTIEVSASQRASADPSGPQEMKYAGSSEEKVPGSSKGEGRINTIFFISKEELTHDANTGGADEGDDLYAYSVATGKLVDITPENNTPSNTPGSSGPNVTFLGSSSDGTLVYFTATSELTEVPNSHGQTASPGASNLYAYDAAAGNTTFIANGAGLNGPSIGLGGIVVPTYSDETTSQVTPDGQHIVFVSSERLTAYDNFGSRCQGSPNNGVTEYSPGRCAEVYLYSRSGNSLVCVSCNPSGGPPVGSARMPTVFREGFLMSDLEPGTLPLPRAISDDGKRVFFDSPDELTAEATAPASTRAPQSLANGGEFEPNVYEYQEGHAHLIASAARFLTSTPSGNDVLFDTYAQLVPQDRDGLPDVYDARVAGGFPVLTAPACSGASCQGNSASAPIFETPAGVTFNGASDNFPPPSSAPAKPKTAAQVRAEKLTKALKSCRAKYPHKKGSRTSCERSAAKRYGAVKKAKAKKAGHSKKASR